MSLIYDFSYSQMIAVANNYLPFILEDYIQEMQGMADGASQGSGWFVTFDDILVQNCFLDLMYGKFIPNGYSSHGILGCTAIGAKNENGSIVIGQNFDFPKQLGRNQICSALAFVHMKFKNTTEQFGMRLGAILALPIVKTSYYTAIVTVIESNILSNYSTPAVLVAREAIERAKSINELINIVTVEHNITVSFTNIITNGTNLIGTQVHPLGYRLRENATVVNTNRYIYEDWNEKYFAGGDFSKARQLYVERLVAEHYQSDHTLTNDELIHILGTQVDGIEGQYSAPCYQENGYGDATLAVFTTQQFGVGTVHNGLGTIPL
jgi:hypothetical protein